MSMSAADFVVFSKSSLTSPPEVFRASLNGANVKPLTQANDPWLKEVAFATPESRSVTAAGGTVQYLADQAAELRLVEKIPRGVPDPWRTPGGMG